MSIRRAIATSRSGPGDVAAFPGVDPTGTDQPDGDALIHALIASGGIGVLVVDSLAMFQSLPRDARLLEQALEPRSRSGLRQCCRGPRPVAALTRRSMGPRNQFQSQKIASSTTSANTTAAAMPNRLTVRCRAGVLAVMTSSVGKGHEPGPNPASGSGPELAGVVRVPEAW